MGSNISLAMLSALAPSGGIQITHPRCLRSLSVFVDLPDSIPDRINTPRSLTRTREHGNVAPVSTFDYLRRRVRVGYSRSCGCASTRLR